MWRTWRTWRPACTHSEDSLRLSAGSHVGVVDVFEHHPGLVVFPHLTERRGRSHTPSGSINERVLITLVGFYVSQHSDLIYRYFDNLSIALKYV